jgi:NagD protein
MTNLDSIHAKKGFICDMDGVLYHGNHLLPGVVEFVNWLKSEKKQFLFLTNSSERSPLELRQKLMRLGLDVAEDHFYTSAIATATFLASQNPSASVYVIGESGLSNALYHAGLANNDVNPDYVVVGESHDYTYERICKAVKLVLKGARLIGTNPDLTGPVEGGLVPATGALMAPIELATGSKAYYVGKPNPLIMRHALKRIGCRREETVIIGDRMDTDIIAGIESEIETILVLTGVSTEADLSRFAYRPHHVLTDLRELL